MNNGKNNVVIIIIIIAIAVFGFLFFKTDVLKGLFNKEHYQIIGDNSKKGVFDNAVNEMINKYSSVIDRMMMVKHEDMLKIKNNVYNKCKTLFPKSIDQLGVKCKDFFIAELKLAKYQVDDKILNALNEKVKYASMYLSYMNKGEGYIPPTPLRLLRSNQSRLAPDQRLGIGNSIVDTINKDHGDLKKSNLLNQFNIFGSKNLTSGIYRMGFANSTPGNKMTDIRGKPKALIRHLASLSSSKDPNSLLMYHGGDVGDILESSGGLTNEETYDEMVNRYMKRTRDPQYRVMKDLTSRSMFPKKSNRTIANEIINKQIINNIKRSPIIQ